MQDDAKKRAAESALQFIQGASVVGLGTGSTAKFAIEAIAALIRDGARLKAVATSIATAALAGQLGIPLVDLNDVAEIDVTIDGADEIDPGFNMIKGGGGALTREKLVALASRKRVIIADESKLVDVLGRTRPLPVEVLPFSWRMSSRLLEKLGCKPILRQSREAAFVTDNGNYILDCECSPIREPRETERQIRLIPGVIESGLFVDIADIIVIGFQDRVEVRARPQ
jgi:ribose 5-phosphate isomerase A